MCQNYYSFLVLIAVYLQNKRYKLTLVSLMKFETSKLINK